MRRLARLFRRRPANQRTVEFVITARDEFTPVLDELARKLAEVEQRALAAKAAIRAAEEGGK